MKSNARILWWVIALLAVLNLTTIGTVIYHNMTQKRSRSEAINIREGQTPLNGKHFRQNIDFDDVQMDIYRDNNRIFRSEANAVIQQINLQKELMFEELQKNTPDSVRLSEISANIGALHKELKESTVKFYLAVKAVCTPEQQTKLRDLFTPLFSDGEGRGGQHGKGKGGAGGRAGMGDGGQKHGNPDKNQ